MSFNHFICSGTLCKMIYSALTQCSFDLVTLQYHRHFQMLGLYPFSVSGYFTFIITLIRTDTFSDTSGLMGSNLTPNIFWFSMIPPGVCFTILELLSIGKVIDHTWASEK